jgi:hypothetical protein
MQYTNLDTAEMEALADELVQRAEDVPMCKGKTDALWIDCGSTDSGRVCPNCRRHGTLLAIAADLRIAAERIRPS